MKECTCGKVARHRIWDSFYCLECYGAMSETMSGRMWAIHQEFEFLKEGMRPALRWALKVTEAYVRIRGRWKGWFS